jgi:hypothetical protein
MVRIALTVLLTIGVVGPAFAEPVVGTFQEVGANCPNAQSISGPTVVNSLFTVADGCTLWITPLNKPNLVYREYLFDERGRFRIYNSTSGPYETASGSRNYFLFPRHQTPAFVIGKDGNVVATLSSGALMTFSAATTRIATFPDVKYSEAADIRLDNQGGVEILSYPGVYLDSGWSLGDPAYHDAKLQSTFKDEKGVSCAVTNSEIFDYVNAIYDEPLFKFQTDPELAHFLSARCPALSTRSLK